MNELIRNARLGWLEYTENGKFAALLLLVLLIYWFFQKEKWQKYHALFKYTTIVVALCICPLTAALLMLYQTKFYDYEWIWNVVPITVVISLALTLIWTELQEKRGKKILFALGVLGILYCCGGMGYEVWNVEEERMQQEQTAEVLEDITERVQNARIVLWAPREIMAYARALNGEICLPYGRNMWDLALNAYSYDAYGEPEMELYQWMCLVEETGQGEISGMEIASELGINQILLPENIKEELLRQIEEYWGTAAEKVGNYYWICTGES